MQHFGVAIVAAPSRPGQSLCRETLKRPEPFEYLLGPTRKTNRATAEADGIVRLDKHGRNAVIGKPERQTEADRTASDNNGLLAIRFTAVGEFRNPRFVGFSLERVLFKRIAHGKSTLSQ